MDKTLAVVVTGGASGLGAACVRRFARLGSPVAILDADVERGTALAAELGGQALFCQVDVTDSQTIQGALDRAARTLVEFEAARYAGGLLRQCAGRF